MNKKQISSKDFDAAVKASYQLGLLEGRDQLQKEMNELRVSSNQMLTVNKELFRLQKKADSHVIISFTLAETIAKHLSVGKYVETRKTLQRAIKKAFKGVNE